MRSNGVRTLKRKNASAGLLLFRRSGKGLEVFLAHPGGPFWSGRDLGVWTVPKGLVEEGEDRPEVDLETHITDVVNLIEFKDLHDVVLLGHSYAGLVVTGVADRVPDRISQLVYLDTGALPDGRSHRDVSARSQEAHRAAGGASRRWLAVPHAATTRAGHLR